MCAMGTLVFRESHKCTNGTLFSAPKDCIVPGQGALIQCLQLLFERPGDQVQVFKKEFDMSLENPKQF